MIKDKDWEALAAFYPAEARAQAVREASGFKVSLHGYEATVTIGYNTFTVSGLRMEEYLDCVAWGRELETYRRTDADSIQYYEGRISIENYAREFEAVAKRSEFKSMIRSVSAKLRGSYVEERIVWDPVVILKSPRGNKPEYMAEWQHQAITRDTATSLKYDYDDFEDEGYDY